LKERRGKYENTEKGELGEAEFPKRNLLSNDRPRIPCQKRDIKKGKRPLGKPWQKEVIPLKEKKVKKGGLTSRVRGERMAKGPGRPEAGKLVGAIIYVSVKRNWGGYSKGD